MRDANEQALFEHERKIDKEERRNAFIDEFVEENTKTGREYYPYEPHNFWHAIEEIDTGTFREEVVLSDPFEVGTEVLRMVAEYWNNEALLEAEHQLDRGRDD